MAKNARIGPANRVTSQSAAGELLGAQEANAPEEGTGKNYGGYKFDDSIHRRSPWLTSDVLRFHYTRTILASLPGRHSGPCPNIKRSAINADSRLENLPAGGSPSFGRRTVMLHFAYGVAFTLFVLLAAKLHVLDQESKDQQKNDRKAQEVASAVLKFNRAFEKDAIRKQGKRDAADLVVVGIDPMPEVASNDAPVIGASFDEAGGPKQDVPSTADEEDAWREGELARRARLAREIGA
jgi:hypothetical protein